MRPTLFLTLASAALLSAACTRTPAPVDAATPSSPASAPAEPAATEAPSSSQAATPAAPTVHLALSGEGFTFVTPSGSTRHLLFAEPADQVVEPVSRALGSQPEHGHNDECGAGPPAMATRPNRPSPVALDAPFPGRTR